MSNGEILIYQNKVGDIKIDVRLEGETVWLTQEQMATLFGKARSTVAEHIQNVFNEGELDEEVVCRKFRQTTLHGAMEGKTQEKEVKHYNLDVVISVGYRVKSPQGTQFRIWATQRTLLCVPCTTKSQFLITISPVVSLSQRRLLTLRKLFFPRIGKSWITAGS